MGCSQVCAKREFCCIKILYYKQRPQIHDLSYSLMRIEKKKKKSKIKPNEAGSRK